MERKSAAEEELHVVWYKDGQIRLKGRSKMLFLHFAKDCLC